MPLAPNDPVWLQYERDHPVRPRVLSLVEKKPTVKKKKNLTPPKLDPKITVAVKAFRIAMTLDVKILRFGHQVDVCVKKWRKNAIFGCSLFQKFNFVCLLLTPMNCSPKTVSIFNFVCPLWTWSVIRI